MALQNASPFPLGQPAPLDVPQKPLGADTAADTYDAHRRLMRFFEEWEWATREERQLSARDRDYVNGAQWSADELSALHKRNQPALVINRIVRKVDYLRGFERRLRSDPKAFPRTPSDEENSDAATQALRYVADDNSFDQIRSAVWDNLLVEGLGGAEVIAEVGEDGVDVRIHHVAWERIWRDPHARRLDFSDARYMGTMTWMDREQAIDTYPGAGDMVLSTLAADVGGWETFSDRPREMLWTDKSRERLLVVQCHYQQRGDWWTATFTKGGFLDDPVVSPYIDRRGKTCSPLRLRAAYMDRDNRCYGTVRQLISPQDELNKRRSKALHLLSVRQVKAEQGAVDDEGKAQSELAKPDGWITVNPGFSLDILPQGDLASGQMELLRHVTAEIDATGPNAAMAGKDPREQSGRAIQAQQQGGAVENEPMIDALRQWDRQIYEATWMRVRQFWDGSKWIRVTDDDKNVKWVGINRPVTLQDELSQMPPDQRAQAMQSMQIQPNDARLQRVVRIENDISDLDVDITVEEGPDISTLMSEQFNFLANRPDVPLQLLIKYNPNLPRKDEMLKDLQDHQDQAAAQQQQAQANALAMENAKIGLLNAQASQATAGASEKQAGALDRTHTMAMQHAYVTAPDHAPPGHEMALANVAGSPVPVAQPQQPMQSAMPDDAVPLNAPQPGPDMSGVHAPNQLSQ